jgi:hypothetical protein
MINARKTTVYDCSIIQLPKIETLGSNITPINNAVEIPFDIQRVYYLFDVPAGETRGGHAHRKLQQLIVAASGSFDLIVDDGMIKRRFTLGRPNYGLYLPPGLWRELDNFSGGGICLVLASLLYSEEDYIRDYKQFLDYKNEI